jgi:multiple sugar transport system substrate-binding protein
MNTPSSNGPLFSESFSRRQFLKTAAVGAAATSLGPFLVGCGGSSASSQTATGPFNWQQYKGTTLSLLLNKHPYTDAMIADLNSFKQLTGMNVKYDIYPEDVYFEKVTTILSSRSSSYDAFMTGAYQTWVYGPAGWIVDLKDYMNDANKTSPDWGVKDFFSNLLASDSWSGSPGQALGTGSAHQWALPWGYEQYVLSYNKRIFDQYKLKVPTNLPELADTAAWISGHVPGVYGIAVRGSRSWATIHPGFLSAYVNYGAQDFSNGLKPAMNSSQAVEMTNLWVKMIKSGGPPNWTQYTWYECGNDLGAGKAAMMYDADILGYFSNAGTKEAGNIASAPMTANPSAGAPTSNVWIWSLAMSNFSKNKDATWLFLQWATGKKHLLWSAVNQDMVDPVRQSVWSDPSYLNQVKTKGPADYLEAFHATQPQARIYFTPEPLFFQVTTSWAATLQTIYATPNSLSDTKAALDRLVSDITNQIQQAGLG